MRTCELKLRSWPCNILRAGLIAAALICQVPSAGADVTKVTDNSIAPTTSPSGQAKVMDLSPITAKNAMDFEVTRDNWRQVTGRLDNIYTDAAIIRERNAAVGDFVTSMVASDSATVSMHRDNIRQAAAVKLKLAKPGFEQLVSAQGSASEEAGVALMELRCLSGENKANIDAGPALIKKLAAGLLRDQRITT